MNRDLARKRALWLIRIGLPIFTLLISLLLVELVARRHFSKPGMHFSIEMWKYAKLVKRKATAELSHEHTPNSHAFLMGVDVKINSIGLRDHEIAQPKPPGTCRILALGDSTTFGWGASFDNLYTKLLERSLNAKPPTEHFSRYEVVNAGVGNYNTAQEVAYFKEHGLALNPDQVWLVWFINDAEPTPVPSENWLAYRSYGYVWLSSALDNVFRNSKAESDYREYYRGLYGDAQPGWIQSQSALAELAKLCREKNIPLRLLLLPEMHTLGSQYEFADIHAKMKSLAEAQKVPVLDLADTFPADADPVSLWVSPTDAHYNDEAMKILAKRIERTLREEAWIP